MSAPLDVIVVGGGIAGMTFATQLMDLVGAPSARVRILSKAPVQESNSFAAQGGVAAVMRAGDPLEQHVRDTLAVGEGLNDPYVVRQVVREGPALIRGLMGIGAHFDTDPRGALALAREGGHSTARVVHHRDRTGEEIVRTLQHRMASTPGIEPIEGARAIDLVVEGEGTDRRCIGVRAVDMRTGDVVEYFAHVVVLATGGAGALFEHTTNPAGATGDGVAMAIRAGVPVRDMAFVQFHPTALHTGRKGPAFLISEAVRGAGARLLDPRRRPLMAGQHPLGDLAPRNVVARAIHREMMRSGARHVWLDASAIGIAPFAHRFPAIAARCRAQGILAGKDLIPVMPAAHYLCGGIRTDDHGRTTLKGLFAVGECAGSGMHGADRLASNSLLEALVIPKRAAQAVREQEVTHPPRAVRVVCRSRIGNRSNGIVGRAIPALTHAMSTHAGIIRSNQGLQLARRVIACIDRQVEPVWVRRRWSPGLMDLRDLLVVARSVIDGALAEPESIGAHHLEAPLTTELK